MDELRIYTEGVAKDIGKKYLESYGFSLQNDYSVSFIRDNHFIKLTICGFHPHDMPWSIDLLIGTKDFCEIEHLNWITISEVKKIISPFQEWQKEALNLNLDSYSVGNHESINRELNRAFYEVETFMQDFLKGETKKLNQLRQIKYLEYLLKPNVYATHFQDGTKEIKITYNDEIKTLYNNT